MVSETTLDPVRTDLVLWGFLISSATCALLVSVIMYIVTPNGAKTLMQMISNTF